MNALLTIEMDNAAFDDVHGGESGEELARILRELAEKVDGVALVPGNAFITYDINGNRVGALRVTK